MRVTADANTERANGWLTCSEFTGRRTHGAAPLDAHNVELLDAHAEWAKWATWRDTAELLCTRTYSLPANFITVTALRERYELGHTPLRAVQSVLGVLHEN